MIAIGFFLLLFGLVAAALYPMNPHRHSLRDFFGAVPLTIGPLLIVLGACKWLWIALP